MYTKDMDSLLASTLNKMVNSYDLHITNKKRYMLFEKNEKNDNYFKGKFMDTNGAYGFVRVEGISDDIFVHGSKKLGAINGDEVLIYVKKYAKDGKKMEGEIVKIVNREVNNKVGEIYHYDGKIMVSLDDKKFNKLICLKDNPETRKLVDGDKVIVSFTSSNAKDEYIFANFVRRIGHITDPGIDILSIIADHEIETEFSDDYLYELSKLQDGWYKIKSYILPTRKLLEDLGMSGMGIPLMTLLICMGIRTTMIRMRMNCAI